MNAYAALTISTLAFAINTVATLYYLERARKGLVKACETMALLATQRDFALQVLQDNNIDLRFDTIPPKKELN